MSKASSASLSAPIVAKSTSKHHSENAALGAMYKISSSSANSMRLEAFSAAFRLSRLSDSGGGVTGSHLRISCTLSAARPARAGSVPAARSADEDEDDALSICTRAVFKRDCTPRLPKSSINGGDSLGSTESGEDVAADST